MKLIVLPMYFPIAIACGAYAGTTVSLIGISHLEGGTAGSDINALSRDGSTAVGWSRSSAGTEAIRFRNGLLQSLGDFDGNGTNSVAYAVSADGNTIVGQGSYQFANGSMWQFTNPAFVWRPDTGLQFTGAGIVSGIGTCITPDGSVWCVAGARGCPWISSVGWVGNQYLPSGPSDIRAISDDGLICFGGEMTVANPNASNYLCKRFTIDQFAGSRTASGSALDSSFCSADGSVGISRGSPEGVYKWTAGGVNLLPNTAGFTVRGTTPTLSHMVGAAQIDGTPKAVVWSPTNGVQTLENYLLATFGLSVNLDGRALTSCNGISANGLVFAGSSTAADGSQEGWILRVAYDWNNNDIDDAQEIRDGLIVDVDHDGIADCYQSGTDCPGSNIAANSGFESGNSLAECASELLRSGSMIGSWQVVSGIVERANRPKSCDASNWASEFGSYSVELRSVGGSPGILRQPILTERGHRYRVNFWMSADCANGGAIAVRASAGRISKVFTRNCDGTGRQSWLRCEFDFVAALKTDMIEFVSEGQPSEGPVLDAISISDITVGCPDDLDGSGVVDGGDLGVLLANWGPCPN
jgi:hypothetical protein